MTNDSVTNPAPCLSAALNYAGRAWPVLILHDVSMGFCSCGQDSADHMAKSAGKHPVARAWREAALADEALLRSVFAGRPRCNIGILTGLRAGIWVLDVDPKHEGDKRLAELCAAHGELPYTYSVRTGSGGMHYYFSLPGDFTPTNSRGTLPAGLDVRGEGGQVVAAPSVTGIGPYEIMTELPIAPAPEWLLDMIRPRIPTDVEHQRAQEFMRSPQFSTLTDRGARYAHGAVASELERLAQAYPGTRGSTAYSVACNLAELLNSPWAQLNEDQVKAGYANAASQAMRHGGDFDDTEAWGAWKRGGQKVGGRGRAAPGSGEGGVLVGWSTQDRVPPFTEGEASRLITGDSTAWVVDNPVDKSANEVPLSVPLSGPGGTFAGPGVPLQYHSIGNVEQASVPVDSIKSTWISRAELADIPPPSWLIDDWLVRDSLAWIIGKPGEAKSFAALSMALCIATGQCWYGKKVHKGRCGYVVAEGVSGMNARVTAWENTFFGGRAVEDIEFLPLPVQVTDMAAWDALIWDVHSREFDLVIVDTQARVTSGLEENSSKEMGLLIEQLERLRRATQACVLTVHHTPKAGGSARGSGAIEGAAQTMLYSSRQGDAVTLSTVKQKDSEPAAPLALKLSSVEVGRVPLEPGAGQAWFSGGNDRLYGGVLQEVRDESHMDLLKTKAKQEVHRVLTDIFPGRGATKAEAWSSISELRKTPKTSFYRAWDQLATDGLVVPVMTDDRLTGRFVFKKVEVPEV